MRIEILLLIVTIKNKNKNVRSLKHPSAGAVTLNIHKSDTTLPLRYANNWKIKMAVIYPRFGSHMKTDKANRLTYPENLYMLGFKALNWKLERIIKMNETKIATVATFSVSHENGHC